MRRVFIAPLFLLASLAAAQAQSISRTCRTDDDRTSVGRCLRPWLDLWEIMRSHEATSADLLFPLIYYTQESVLSLCDVYLQARDGCLTDRMLTRCRNDLTVRFVQSHMQYFCAGDNAVEALARFDCLSRTVKANDACREHIRGIPLPGHQSRKCKGIPSFFQCLSRHLIRDCGTQAVEILEQAIDAFGCSTDRQFNEFLDEQFQKETKTTPFDVPPGAVQFSDETHTTLTTTDQSITTNTTQVSSEATSSQEEFNSTEERTTTAAGPGLILLNEITTTQRAPVTNSTRLERMSTKPTRTRGPGLMLLTSPTPAPPGLILANQSSESSKENASTSSESSESTIFPFPQAPSLPTELDTDSAEGSGEVEGSGESEEIIPQPDTPTVRQTSLACTPDLETRVGQCLSPLSRRWEQIHQRMPFLRESLFPLYNYSTQDLLNLCEIVSVTLEDCLDEVLLAACFDHPAIQFVNSMLGFACGPDQALFFLNYDCLHEVTLNNGHCYSLIPGQNVPGTGEAKCKRMPLFYDCMETPISNTCNAASLRIFLRSILHFGCDIQFNEKQVKPERLPVVESDIEVSKGEVIQLIPKLPQTTTTGRPPLSFTVPTDINPDPSTQPTLSSRCTPQLLGIAHDCILPLMENWSAMRERKPHLNEIAFPLYKYPKNELLNLCDGYANSFLCGGFEPFTACFNDPLVRFANSQLGYVCSPQNIQGFLIHYDCIMGVVETAGDDCMQFIRGPNIPGEDLNKCRGVPQFYSCIERGVRDGCQQGALREFQETILQFGCNIF